MTDEIIEELTTTKTLLKLVIKSYMGKKVEVKRSQKAMFKILKENTEFNANNRHFNYKPKNDRSNMRQANASS